MPLLFIALALALFLGIAVRRWWVVGVPVVVSAGVALFLALNDGWYGAGWGDFGVEFNVIAAVLSVLLAAFGVALRPPPHGSLQPRRREVSNRDA